MKNILLVFISMIAFSSCGAQQGNQSEEKKEKSETMAESNIKETGMVHTVYFWLTDDVTEERKKEFEQALIDLSTVPSIDKFYWGTPAATTPRDVIDDSYDYAINVFFESIEAEAAYQVDPIHDKFVETQKAIFRVVKVYNNLY